MQISRLQIHNFRGIKYADLFFPAHAVLIGDNNTGKTTVFEALDLVLGPERLNRFPRIDEHDFYRGVYTRQHVNPQDNPEVDTVDSQISETSDPQIIIEATIVDLTNEQKLRFSDYAEFWDGKIKKLYQDANPSGIDPETISQALRVSFVGSYSEELDDFEGDTYFSRTMETSEPERFTKHHKQICGFLYLRSLRTGTRALSLERGSLLDIILRLKEVRPLMWESAINQLSEIDIANDPALGISGILESINTALKKYVPREWGCKSPFKSIEIDSRRFTQSDYCFYRHWG